METAQHSLPMPFKPTLKFTNVIHQNNNLRIHIKFLYAEDAINDYSIELTISGSSFIYSSIYTNKMLQSKYDHHFYYKTWLK